MTLWLVSAHVQALPGTWWHVHFALKCSYVGGHILVATVFRYLF